MNPNENIKTGRNEKWQKVNVNCIKTVIIFLMEFNIFKNKKIVNKMKGVNRVKKL